MAAKIFENSFPTVTNDEIDTVKFLDASRGIIWLIEKFGSAFNPVKGDILHNVEKLNKRYTEDPATNKCLKRMILEEKNRNEDFAIESLLWLRRSLTMLCEFLIKFVEYERNNVEVENIHDILHEAYHRTLRHHHSFFLSIGFMALLKFAPDRSNFLKIITSEEIDDHAQLIILLDDYTKNLSNVLKELQSVYEAHNIQPHS